MRFCILLGACLLAAAEDPLTGDLKRWSGRERGVAVVADGGTLAAALTAASGLIVLDQQPDEAARMRAAQAAEIAGSLGRRHYVAIGSPAACALADGYADLVVVAAATPARLTAEMARELARIAAPQGGTVVVGNPDASALPRPALEAWMRQLGAEARVQDGASGSWVVWKRPALAGSDDWTHWYYDAGGNPASHDTALTAPFDFAWTARPMQTTRTQTRVAAGGRLFAIFHPHQKEGMFQTHRFEGGDQVMARSLANGELLWTYVLGDDTYAMRSSLIATAEAVYVMRRERVLVLDPQTGAERTPIVLAQPPGEVKCIALRDHMLVALVGATRDVPEFCPTANVQTTIGRFKKITADSSYGFGDTLVAWDVQAGSERWRWRAPAPIDSRVVGISPAGIVVAYAKDMAVVGLGLADGAIRWQQRDPALLEKLAKLDPSDHWGYNMVSRPGLAMNDAIALIAHGGSAQAVALNPADGSLRWDAARNYQFPVQTAIVGDRIAATSLAAGPWLDAATGGSALGDPKQKLNLSGANNASCGQVTASGRYILGCSGGPLFTIDGQQPLLPTLVKAECGLGNLVADGTMVQAPGACSGCNRIMGFLAIRSFAPLDLRTPADDPTRLTTGTGRPGSLAVDARDWPTRRHDQLRSAGSPASLPKEAVIRWRWMPPHPYPVVGGNIANLLPLDTGFRPTQPVSAGNLVVVAGDDGIVTALDRTSGSERWRTRLGGRIHASPTLADGRVLVGCADGTVSALSSSDGALIWRYRLAPHERRVMSYGHLESPWPVVCSPVVADGTVYAAAGRPMVPGGYAVALDAATGSPRWMQSWIPWSGDGRPVADRSKRKDEELWITPYGELALLGERLVLRTRGSTGPAGLVLDRRTGARISKQQLFDHDLANGRQQGGDTVILPDGMILGGGYEVDLDQNACSTRLPSLGAAVIAADGAIRHGTITEHVGGAWQGQNRHLPCWNSRTLVQPGFGAWGLVAFPLDAWQANLAPQLVARPPYGFTTKLAVEPVWGPISPDSGEAVANKWAKVGSLALAVVVGGDAAVATSRIQIAMADGPFKGESFKLAQISGGRVSAFDLATGSRRWTVDLPSAPALDALALDRDGSTLVALQDGSVVSIGSTP